MRLQDGMRAAAPRSAWRFFPVWVAGSMGVVIAVNIFMAYTAIHTFPGKAGGDGFDLSNRYNAVIDHAKAQAALGWAIAASANGERQPVVALADAQGKPITGARVAGSAMRPLGLDDKTVMAFHEVAPGRYVGEAPLVMIGQWELLLTASAQGHDVSAARRIVVR